MMDSEKLLQKAKSCFKRKEYEETRKICKEILLKDPKSIKVIQLIYKCSLLLNKPNDSLIYLNKIIEIEPQNFEAIKNIGNIYFSFRDFERARFYYKESLAINPNFAPALTNLGAIESTEGKPQKALEYQLCATDNDPNNFIAWVNLSNVYFEMGELEGAEKALERANNIEPDNAGIEYNLGNILKAQGKVPEAINSYLKSLNNDENNLRAKNELLQSLIKVSDLNSIEKYLPFIYKKINKPSIEKNYFKINDPIDPYLFLSLEDNPENELIRSKIYSNLVPKQNIKEVKYQKKEKIYIGYFSADFHEHPVMKILLPILEKHDLSKFKIFIYSFVDVKNDKYKNKLVNLPFTFRELEKLDIKESISIARNDKLDIAIDLMGYTLNNRIEIFSNRVAPIQINYLGYPSTTGLDQIDYIIADKIVIPSESCNYYSEEVIYKEQCYISSNNTTTNKKLFKRDLNLPERSFILAAFHQVSKITNKEIDSWSRILCRINNSFIWIRNTNLYAKLNIIKSFEERNISKNRIIFAERLESEEDHLARHNCADLFIDSFNYNAHSSAIDALSTGLPVVTLLGRSFSARVCGSILHTLGLNELISKDIIDYENIIVSIANNPEKLLTIKNKISKAKLNNSFFDPNKNRKSLENIYEELVERLYI